MGLVYATAIASAGMASSTLEVLTKWPPGLVLASADQIAWRNAQQNADLDAARGGT
jgi:hypothetical protein